MTCLAEWCMLALILTSTGIPLAVAGWPSAAPGATWRQSRLPLSRSSVSSSTRRSRWILISRTPYAPPVFWSKVLTSVVTWSASNTIVATAGKLVMRWSRWRVTNHWWGTRGQEEDQPPGQPSPWHQQPSTWQILLNFHSLSPIETSFIEWIKVNHSPFLYQSLFIVFISLNPWKWSKVLSLSHELDQI